MKPNLAPQQSSKVIWSVLVEGVVPRVPRTIVSFYQKEKQIVFLVQKREFWGNKIYRILKMVDVKGACHRPWELNSD